MTDTPIRQAYSVGTEFFKDPSEYTLRDAVEWFKDCVKISDTVGAPSPRESNLMDEQWVVLIRAIAEKQQIPLGPLSYFLAELAATEMALLNTSQLEAEQAELEAEALQTRFENE